MITGRTYLEHGHPVVILCGWGPGSGDPDATNRYFAVAPKRFGPRNCAIRRSNGDVVVRPFRGLRKSGGAA